MGARALEALLPAGAPQLKVIFLGVAREVAAVSERRLLVTAPLTLSALRERLYADHPALLPLAPVLRWVVNGAFEPHASRSLVAGDTVALLLPFSGG